MFSCQFSVIISSFSFSFSSLFLLLLLHFFFLFYNFFFKIIFSSSFLSPPPPHSFSLNTLFFVLKLLVGQSNLSGWLLHHCSAVKFDTGYEKKNELSCGTKIFRSSKKDEKIGLGSFKFIL